MLPKVVRLIDFVATGDETDPQTIGQRILQGSRKMTRLVDLDDRCF